MFGFFNYWRTFRDNERSWVWLNVDGPGQYRIGVTYHWYATKSVPEHEEYYWAAPTSAKTSTRCPTTSGATSPRSATALVPSGPGAAR